MPGDSAARIRVAVVAHDPRARTSLLHLLASHDNIVVIPQPAPDECSARHAPAAADGPNTDRPVDVVVIDLAPLPPEDRDARLAALPGSVAIVVLGNDCATAAAARTIGATYLDKVDVADQLLAAVHSAAASWRRAP